MSERDQALAEEAATSRVRGWTREAPTGLLVLADGTVIEGKGAGAPGIAVGEVCFNTAMTGYQEILTDPSYAGQIITFTFPHIGNVGTNDEDMESASLATGGVRGCVLRGEITAPSNWRAGQSLDYWLKARGIIAVTGVDTRALTALIREKGMPNAVIAHAPDGKFDLAALKRQAAATPSMEGQDLASEVSTSRPYVVEPTADRAGHVVAYDLGIKRDILSNLTSRGYSVEVVPSGTPASVVMKSQPDGVFISNGPGDPEPLESTIDALRSSI